MVQSNDSHFAVESIDHELWGKIMRIFEILTYIGCVIGMLLLFSTFAATGAPQEAAGAAMAVAFCVIPYCVTATLQRAALLRRN